MEHFLQENLAGKWFCELDIEKKAPDHSYFGDFRKRLGTERLMNIFFHVRASLREMGFIKETFTFADAGQSAKAAMMQLFGALYLCQSSDFSNFRINDKPTVCPPIDPNTMPISDLRVFIAGDAYDH